jgi:hypothetical protein
LALHLEALRRRSGPQLRQLDPQLRDLALDEEARQHFDVGLRRLPRQEGKKRSYRCGDVTGS